jgi:hypothetical protein
MNEKIFTTIIIVLSFCSSFPYFFQGDWRKGTYWLCAAIIGYVVTY